MCFGHNVLMVFGIGVSASGRATILICNSTVMRLSLSTGKRDSFSVQAAEACSHTWREDAVHVLFNMWSVYSAVGCYTFSLHRLLLLCAGTPGSYIGLWDSINNNDLHTHWPMAFRSLRKTLYPYTIAYQHAKPYQTHKQYQRESCPYDDTIPFLPPWQTGTWINALIS